jgi:hypothetical protein
MSETEEDNQEKTGNGTTPKILTDNAPTNSGITNYIEAHDRLFGAISSMIIAIFTIVLAISTVYLWRSTAGLETFAKQQASDMKEYINAAKDAAKAASDANRLNRDNFLSTERHMKESINAAKDAEKAASDANRLNRDNFLATARPWITTDIEVGGPLIYNVNGINITLQFHLKNVGHSPATHISIIPQLIAPAIGIQNFDPLAAQHKIYTRTKTAPLDKRGFTLFPGDTITQNITVILNAEELKRITEKVNFIKPFIVGTIDYSFVFENGHHQTGFILEVARNNAPRPESMAKNRDASTIFLDEGDIPASELRLYRTSFFWGGEQAD